MKTTILALLVLVFAACGRDGLSHATDPVPACPEYVYAVTDNVCGFRREAGDNGESTRCATSCVDGAEKSTEIVSGCKAVGLPNGGATDVIGQVRCYATTDECLAACGR